MKIKNALGLFDESDRLKKLSNQGDPLVKLNKSISWESFRPILNQILATQSPKGKGGRPSYDPILMFKILILQRYYNLSDDQVEYQILDRLSFMRFLGLQLSDSVPDSKTVWVFREKLTENNRVKLLFDHFEQSLSEQGFFINEGKILDASFVETPRQRNKEIENFQIKEGEIPEDWKENPSKLRQKDVDAKWTKKNNETFYGYKDHVNVDCGSKLLKTYVVTDASVHDSQVTEELLSDTQEGEPLYADSAYFGEPIAKILETKGIDNQIHQKGIKAKPLTEKQIESNNRKSKTRVRVEHVFGFIENSMNGSFIRTIGKKRAEAVIGLMNLTYNMFRAIQIMQIKGINVSI